MGSRLLGPNRGNRRGHYEDRDFLDFHEGILRRQVLIQDASLLKAPGEGARDQALGLIEKRRGSGLWGWKDPRTSLFLDFWAELLPQARFLFVFRHPIDVVLSLMRRRFDSEIELLADPLVGMVSWQIYNSAILKFYHQHPERCVLSDVDGVTADAGGFVEATQGRLGLVLQAPDTQQLVYREELHATRCLDKVDAILHKICPAAAELYDKLGTEADLELEAPNPVQAAEDLELNRRLDEVARLIDGCTLKRETRSSFLALVLALVDSSAVSARGEDLRRYISRLEKHRKGLQQHVDNLEALHAYGQDRVRELTRHGENLEGVLKERATEMENLRTHAKNLETLTYEHRGRIRDLEQELTTTKERLAELEASQDRTHHGGTGSAGEDLLSRIARQEALAAEARERVRELTRHTENLELVLKERVMEMEGLRAHGQNLEHILKERTKEMESLHTHAQNLEHLLKGRTAEMESLHIHTENLERILEERATAIEDLHIHTENLERILEERATAIEDLHAHARNLEVSSHESRRHAGNLEQDLATARSHIANLEALTTEHQDRIRQLMHHCENLQEAMNERTKEFEDLRTHAENLEARRREDGRSIRDLKRQLDATRQLVPNPDEGGKNRERDRRTAGSVVGSERDRPQAPADRG